MANIKSLLPTISLGFGLLAHGQTPPNSPPATPPPKSPVAAPKSLVPSSAPAPSKDLGARRVLFVKDSVRLIEMPSLQKDLASQGSYSIDAQFSSLDSFGARTKDDGHMAGDTANSDFNEEPFTAMQVYGFKVQPGDTLKLELDSDTGSLMAMSFLQPKDATPMISQITRANALPRPVRRRHIDLKNITKEPYEAILILRGQMNYPYRLFVKRASDKD